MMWISAKESLLLICITTLQHNFIAADANSSSHNLFARSLLTVSTRVLKGEEKSTANVVISPVSLNVTLALLFLGSRDFTAAQLSQALNIQYFRKLETASKYSKFLKELNRTDLATKVAMNTRIFITTDAYILPRYRKLVTDLGCQVESVDFTHDKSLLEKVNTWIENFTKSKIQLPIKENDLNNLQVLFINIFYLKAKWLYPFNPLNTTTENSARIMHQTNYVQYAVLNSLNVTAYEFPFAYTDISMMFIVPNDGQNLGTFESKLRELNLNDIASNMTLEKQDIKIPKFRLLFNIDLINILTNFGIFDIFTPLARLNNMFTIRSPQFIETISQMVYLEFNEFGVEAIALNYNGVFTKPRQYEFRSPQSFIFFIRNRDVVYFAGRVEKNV